MRLRLESTYRDENPSEGGYVYTEHGYYRDVAILDVASMHPTSIIQLDIFGPYTERFKDLTQTRLGIKRGDYETVRSLLGGKFSKYVEGAENDPDGAKALKIVINIVYGLTPARFENSCL